MNALVTFTVPQLCGLVLFTGLLGGTIATLAPRFLAWTDLRRAEREVRKVFPDATRVPEQRRGARS